MPSCRKHPFFGAALLYIRLLMYMHIRKHLAQLADILLIGDPALSLHFRAASVALCLFHITLSGHCLFADTVKDRIVNINNYITFSFYSSVCRSLFEKHKLMFAFLVCTQILMNDGRIDMVSKSLQSLNRIPAEQPGLRFTVPLLSLLVWKRSLVPWGWVQMGQAGW